MFRSQTKVFTAIAMCFLVVASALPQHKTFAGIINVGETVPLSQLLTGLDSIVVGDKTFDDFFYAPTGGAPAAGDVMVTGVQQGGGYGLVFTSGGFAAGGFNDLSLDASLGFRVSVDDPTKVIVGAELFGTTLTDGSGDARIAETFSNVPGASMLIRQFRIEDDLITSKSSDTVYFGGVSELFVLKDISIEVPEEGSSLFDLGNLAEITTFRQLFFQDDVVIPEPTTLSLAGLALLGVVCRQRKRC